MKVIIGDKIKKVKSIEIEDNDMVIITTIDGKKLKTIDKESVIEIDIHGEFKEESDTSTNEELAVHISYNNDDEGSPFWNWKNVL